MTATASAIQRQVRVGYTQAVILLAAAAAAVSFTAQYRMVSATRHLPAIAAAEAAIPDTAALVFASLGIALALHGPAAPCAPAPSTSPRSPPASV